MKPLTLFHLNGCPYCIKAKKALAELDAEDPRYAGVGFEWIEEEEHPEIAAKYDYYYVPCVFDDTEKLYEADPRQSYDDIKASLRAVIEAYL